MRVYQPERINYLLALTAFIAFFSLPAVIAQTNTQYYIPDNAHNANANAAHNAYNTYNNIYNNAYSAYNANNSYYYAKSNTYYIYNTYAPSSSGTAGNLTSAYYFPQTQSAFPANPSYYYPPARLPDVTSSSSAGLLNRMSSTSEYYYPSMSPATPLPYLSYNFTSGSYYFPNNSYASSTGYSSGYYNIPGSSYFISNTGYYIPDSRLASGGSPNFYIPSQAASFSPSSSCGYSGFYNLALFPFTPFFINSQFSPSTYLNGKPFTLPAVGRRASSVASLVMANPTRGMYCWDPLSWLNAGFQLGIWDKNLPIRAQTLDQDGFLLPVAPAFTVQTTGQTGNMVLFRSDLQLYEGLAEGAGSADYLVTAWVDAASVTTVAHRRNTSCDFCHPAPPGHIAVSDTWGRCSICHNLGNVVHIHAYRAGIAIDNCYQCHPTGCLTGVHGQVGLWCVDCHGSLLDAENHQMLIPGQLGMPHCADCHDPLHSENLPAIFMSSAGHGGIWCINCHAATHTESALPLGYNNCTLCHTTQAGLSWMGPDCQACHSSSVSPHMVTL